MSEVQLLNNRYQLESHLGKGGMAMVYRARDLMLERTVAVKVLREDFSADRDFRERFRQEARAAANLSHPNIVTVHDFGLDSGRLFIVMEFVPGTDLKTLVARRGPFKVDEALQLMIQSCAGIGYAHRAGLVHCDVKPHNMLVTPDQRMKVVDFGIARALASIQPEETVNVVWGSPQYFSPEQAAGRPPSPASDVYSLGVVFFEMLTGRLPFIASNASDLAQMHRESPPPSPRSINAEVPPALEQILLKVLSKEPSARYRTADQLGRVLMSFNRSTPLDAALIPIPEEKSGASTFVLHPGTQPSRTRQRGATRPASPQSAMVGSPQPSVSPVRVVEEAEEPEDRENPLDIDWGTWALGLLALLAVGGLIPLWMWVYFLYNPPTR